MGGLHGDSDRDFRDTNLIVLARDLAALHADVRRLFAHLEAFTQNETDAIDAALVALSSQVQRETTEIDTNLARETQEIDGALRHLTHLVTNETDELDSAVATLEAKVVNETTQIDAAITALAGQVDAETTEIDDSLAAVNASLQRETSEIDAALTALDERVAANTSSLSAALSAHEAHLGRFEASAGLEFTAIRSAVADEATEIRANVTAVRVQAKSDLDAAETALRTEVGGVRTALSAHDAALPDNVTLLINAIRSGVEEIKVETSQLGENLTSIRAQIQTDHRSVESVVSTGVTDLKTLVGNSSATVQEQLAAMKTSLEANVSTVDAVVDGIAAQVGTPSAGQETIFKEFEGMQKGKEWADIVRTTPDTQDAYK